MAVSGCISLIVEPERPNIEGEPNMSIVKIGGRQRIELTLSWTVSILYTMPTMILLLKSAIHVLGSLRSCVPTHKWKMACRWRQVTGSLYEIPSKFRTMIPDVFSIF